MLTTGCRDDPYISPCNKKKRPNQNKTIQKSIIKNAKAQHRAAGWKNLAWPGIKRAPEVYDAREQPQTGLTSQPEEKHFWKKLCPVNNNLKKKTSRLDPFKVHPGLQHPEGPRLQHLQQWNAAGHDKGKGVHTENNEKKKRRKGENKRISQKLLCASCGDMPWTRWIGPNPGSWKKHKG